MSWMKKFREQTDRHFRGEMYLTQQELDEVNLELRAWHIEQHENRLQSALRPDLMPPFQPLQELDFGDRLYGVRIRRKV